MNAYISKLDWMGSTVSYAPRNMRTADAQHDNALVLPIQARED